MKKALLLLALIVFSIPFYAQMRISVGVKNSLYMGSDLRNYMNGFSVDVAMAKKMHGGFGVIGGASFDSLEGSANITFLSNKLSYIGFYGGIEYETRLSPIIGFRVSPTVGVVIPGGFHWGGYVRLSGDMSCIIPVSPQTELEPIIGVCWYTNNWGSSLQLYEIRTGLRIGYNFSSFGTFD